MDTLYVLLSKAQQKYESALAKHLQAHKLTSRQLLVLSCLNRQPLIQTELVDETSIDRSTVSDIVKRLVEKGLVSRRRKRSDVRALLVTITSQGELALSGAQEAVGKALLDVTQDMELSKVSQLIALLREFTEGPPQV